MLQLDAGPSPTLLRERDFHINIFIFLGFSGLARLHGWEVPFYERHHKLITVAIMSMHAFAFVGTYVYVIIKGTNYWNDFFNTHGGCIIATVPVTTMCVGYYLMFKFYYNSTHLHIELDYEKIRIGYFLAAAFFFSAIFAVVKSINEVPDTFGFIYLYTTTMCIFLLFLSNYLLKIVFHQNYAICDHFFKNLQKNEINDIRREYLHLRQEIFHTNDLAFGGYIPLLFFSLLFTFVTFTALYYTLFSHDNVRWTDYLNKAIVLSLSTAEVFFLLWNIHMLSRTTKRIKNLICSSRTLSDGEIANLLAIIDECPLGYNYNGDQDLIKLQPSKFIGFVISFGIPLIIKLFSEWGNW